MKLTEQKSRLIEAGATPLGSKEAETFALQVPAWSLREKELRREFRFKDFRQAMEFTNKVAAIANEQDHHPDISISYNKVTLVLTTHKIGGLSMNDFIVAARIDLMAGAERSERAA